MSETKKKDEHPNQFALDPPWGIISTEKFPEFSAVQKSLDLPT